MTKTRQKGIIRATGAIFVALVCLIMLFSLAACDEKEEASSVRYGLYLAGCTYDDETLTVTAHVSISGTAEQRLDGLTLEGVRVFKGEGLFYNRTNITVALDVPAIYDAVSKRGVLERTVRDEDGGESVKKYQSLQVVMRYATIYKSIVTNGTRHPSGSGYVDILPLDGEGAQEFEISQRSQNTANWYTLLVAAGIALFAALMGAYLAHMHKKEKALPQEETYAEKD